MTLTPELDLDILPLDLHDTFQFRMSVHSVSRVVTHTHGHTRCQNYYTRHVTDVSQTGNLFFQVVNGSNVLKYYGYFQGRDPDPKHNPGIMIHYSYIVFYMK